MHEDALKECLEWREEFKKHIAESVPFRRDVDKHNDQIITLNKAHEACMQDIKEIKNDLKSIRDDLLGIRIWILTSAIAGLIVVAGEALYFGGYLKQVDINTSRITEIENAHPRVGK